MLNIQDMADNNGLVADELFDFDYSSDFVSDWASTEWQGNAGCDTVSYAVKSASTKAGSKHHVAKRSKLASAATATAKEHRKIPLLIFPSYDRCDSLLFFPTAMAKYLNSDDMESATKLVSKHLSNDCKICIDFCPHQHLNAKSLMRLTSMLNEMQPDRVMCVHSTRVIQNQIRADVYFKSTESKAVTDGVERETRDPLFSSVFHMSRNDRLKQRIRERGEQSEEEEMRLCNLVDSDVDLLVYVHMYMHITFDDHTKKVTALDVGGTLTSLHAVV